MLRLGLFLVIFFIGISLITFSTFIPNAFAQSTSTKLILDPFPTSVKTGDIVTFTGQLFTADEQYVITDATIYIKDEDTLDFNDFLVTTKTDSAGKFSANWQVKNVDSGGLIIVGGFVVVEGTCRYSFAVNFFPQEILLFGFVYPSVP